MAGLIELVGITWDHSRALPPLVATSQRYEETHAGVSIRWEKRSLHEFGHMPVDQLAERFDLVVIDHPWAGFAFEHGLFLDLHQLLGAAANADLEKNSLGPTYASYDYGGRLLAVPIDTAAPCPSWRPDLLQRAGVHPPRTWSELTALARLGLVVMPGFPADLFLNFHMLCVGLGGTLFAERSRMVDRDTGLLALDLLRELADYMPDETFSWNPINVAELLTESDHFAYCPFAFSYANYCRVKFARHQLRYGKLVTLDDGRRLRSVVGGTGIAISSSCKSPDVALDYALFTGSADVQSGIYALAGGQPSRREAWCNSALDAVCGRFFSHARQDHEQAIIRPRYEGYVPLQELAGKPLRQHLLGEIAPGKALDAVDAAYRASLPKGAAMPPL